MNDLRKDNHFIQQHLLNKWANEEGKVWTYRLLVSHENVPFWTSIRASSVASQDYLYCQKTTNGFSDEIERWLCDEVENKAVPVINKVNLESKMTTHDWSILIKYALVQDLRTPKSFFEFNKIISDEMPNINKELLSELKEILKATKPSISQKVEIDSKFPFKISLEPNSNSSLKVSTKYSSGRSAWIYFIKDLTESYHHIAIKHKWTIIKPCKGQYWPVSDCPVIKLRIFKPNGEYDFKGNWANVNGCILMPLGPEHLLFTQIGTRIFNKFQRMDARLTTFIQKIISESAFENIFNFYPREEITKFRSRVVSAEKYKAREKFWKSWNEMQSKSEMEFH